MKVINYYAKIVTSRDEKFEGWFSALMLWQVAAHGWQVRIQRGLYSR